LGSPKSPNFHDFLEYTVGKCVENNKEYTKQLEAKVQELEKTIEQLNDQIDKYR
jgi:predicted RNase H-like nuclease (RuvC/YqgF family)